VRTLDPGYTVGSSLGKVIAFAPAHKNKGKNHYILDQLKKKTVK